MAQIQCYAHSEEEEIIPSQVGRSAISVELQILRVREELNIAVIKHLLFRLPTINLSVFLVFW